MLQTQFIKENKQVTLAGLAKKNFKNAEESVEKVLALDQQRRELQQDLDTTLARSNVLAKEIGALMKDGKKVEAEAAKAETSQLKTRSKTLEEQLRETENTLNEILVLLPNLPHASVPFGKTPEENEVVLLHGDIPVLPETAQPHWECPSPG